MSYLFLSFSENLERGSKDKNDFYKDSLEEQFNQLSKRIPVNRRSINLESFINICFPTGLFKKYYISCPNFLRAKKEGDYVTFLKNVIIRPELTASMKNRLPDNQNIILIGDIRVGPSLKCLTVKGLQLIDESMKSKHDITWDTAACNSFEKNVWSISGIDYSSTIFTEDNIDELIRNCWTVSNHRDAIKNYEMWEKYIKFRKYYLDEQSKRNFLLDEVKYIQAYSVNRKEYKRNSTFYDDVILDNLDEFKRGDMIILSEKIHEAEEFPLIRINIDRNRKQFLANRIYKGKSLISEEEKRIRILSRDNVFITQNDPIIMQTCDRRDRDFNFRMLIKNGYELGDRFKLIVHDVKPEEHISQLTKKCDNDIKTKFDLIDSEYIKKIDLELRDSVKTKTVELNNKINDDVAIYRKKLDDSLQKDVNENSDSDILRTLKEKERTIKNSLLIKNKKDKKEKDKDYNNKINNLVKNEMANIDLKALYVERNNKLIKEFENKKAEELRRNIKAFEDSKLKELNNKYAEEIRTKKNEFKNDCSDKLNKDIDTVIENETIRRFSLYYCLNEAGNKPSEKLLDTINSCKYLVYDSRAEKAKIYRQEQALNNFYNGYVKNPYLSTYLFSPKDLHRINYENVDWHWYLESLNEKQKEAVRKAVYSNGIFLLQGPPGTGKTQVIAETVAHLVKMGKKVLISSETHKAIDNVFERLPKIGDIVPIRLIPSYGDRKKENEFDPKYLVDNFYLNISDNMKNSIERYKNFKKNKEEFNKDFETLKLNNAKLIKSQNTLDKAKRDISKLEEKASYISKIISNMDDDKDLVRIKLDKLRRTQRHINKDSLKLDDDIEKDIIINYRNEIEPLFKNENIYVKSDLGQLLKTIDSLTMEELLQEISLVNPKNHTAELEIKKQEIKLKKESVSDEIGEPLPGKEDEFERYKKELREIVNEINSGNKKDQFDGKLTKIFTLKYLTENLSIIEDTFRILKENIIEKKIEFEKILNEKIAENEEKENQYHSQIRDKNSEIKAIEDQIFEINDRSEIKEINDIKNNLETAILKFFKDFEISESYNDIDEALNIISNKWQELEMHFEEKEQENREKIPMYEKIVKYISSTDVIETDRKEYTKDLFESANVFGITCTSRDNFKKGSMEALNEYNIEELDIKKVGIDVVIIDEVSKSSFVDLLIPILYGKTVILVGDHRQLPPMYDLAKLRDDDISALDEEYITPELNKKFTNLYEECFFKTLFEKIPDDYKTMLVQQYRCHEHIMHVFNHFYSGQLKLGNSPKKQNGEKQHNIKLLSNGRYIIEPDKHIYFVNCKEYETHEDDSTSMYNKGEAKVVVELIRKINDYLKNNPGNEKLSIGVISTYGDQASRIKKMLSQEKVKTNAFKQDEEKMIVSTVDDFQGDERDIIILTTVRNPIDPVRSKPEFILAYQRINVALSRARRLLIVVGNRKYLQDKGEIYLPDINGDITKDIPRFRLYDEIIGTIERYGKIIQDVDVLEQEEVKING